MDTDMNSLVQFQAACNAGRLEEAKALVAEHGVRVDALVVANAAGVHGHLSMCQWAVAEHGVNLHGMPGITILYRACEVGHLHVCQWLIAEYGFEPADWIITSGRSFDQRVREVVMHRGLEIAVEHRHWPIALWLVQRRPEHPWPAAALCQLIAHSWGPARDAWMRSVVR